MATRRLLAIVAAIASGSPCWVGRLLLLSGLAFVALRPSLAAPAPEAYATLPIVDFVTMSPSGKRLALRYTNADSDFVAVYDLAANEWLNGAAVTDTKPGQLIFASDEQLVVTAQNTAIRESPYVQSSRYVVSVLNVSTGLVRRVLPHVEFMPWWPLKAVGASNDGTSVYLPAFHNHLLNFRYSLFGVTLGQNTERVIDEGHEHGIGWFVDADGGSLIREDYDSGADRHQLWVIEGDQERLIYENVTPLRRMTPIGLVPDRSALVVTIDAGTGHSSIHKLRLSDGKISGPIFEREEARVARVITDINRVVHGAEYAGFKPTYEFFEEALTARIADIQASLPDMAVRLQGFSEDFDELVMHVSAAWSGGSTFVFSRDSAEPQIIGFEPREFDGSDIAPTVAIHYAARDGREIPAFLTAHKSVLEAGPGPLIVLPQGGRESHDRYGYQWLAQYFASRNYVVLQPLFRGSDGFGWDHRTLDRGGWGGKMPTDLVDGVRFLIDERIAAAGRACAIGVSYGAYAAMASASVASDLFRCAVSVNGISDVRELLTYVRDYYEDDHWVIRYWQSLFDIDANGTALSDAFSAANHVENFDFPLLLIHSRRNRVVPVEQSRRMYKALKKAGAEVKFRKLRGGDHWLSDPGIRLQALDATAEFVEQHLPPELP